MFQVDVNTENGGLTLNRKFTIDFGEEPQGKLSNNFDLTASVVMRMGVSSLIWKQGYLHISIQKSYKI